MPEGMGTIGDGVAGAVRSARRKKGLTQEQLAEAVGSTPEIVSRIESGATVATLETFTELARALEFDVVKTLGLKIQVRKISFERTRRKAEVMTALEGLSDAWLADLAAITELFSRS